MRQKKWTIPALIAGSAIFCIIPYAYQWITGNNADWQAWWAFGTFLIALIAALIAYQEYNAHIRATQPQLIANSEKLDKNNSAITLTNVGGGTATAITVKLLPGIKLKPVSGLNDADKPINLETTIPMLEPQQKTLAFDRGNLFVAEMRAVADQAKQTVHLEWNDTTGKHYKNDNLKLDFNQQVIKVGNMTVEHDDDKVQRLQQLRETSKGN